MLPPEIMGMIDDEEEHEKLGACGCTDYHMADCPTRTGAYDDSNGGQSFNGVVEDEDDDMGGLEW
jgi:hypothetical protein